MIGSRPNAPGAIETFSCPPGGETPVALPVAAADLDYLLRRAEEEAIATVRLGDTPAAERHAEMAALYSARALDLLDAGQDKGAGSG